MNQYDHPLEVSKPDAAVVIEATLQQWIADGSRTFLAKHVAKECQNNGHNIRSCDVARFCKHSKNFAPMKSTLGGIRWQYVGEALA